uniref:Uncharacterized protein n=1 Tax=Anguilla anguilla TaxID=7936 RepID=A0A0E9PE67_ANGAN
MYLTSIATDTVNLIFILCIQHIFILLYHFSSLATTAVKDHC